MTKVSPKTADVKSVRGDRCELCFSRWYYRINGKLECATCGKKPEVAENVKVDPKVLRN